MNTDIACFEISCPECFNMIILDLKYDHSESGLLKNLSQIMGKITGEIKHYSFKGMKRCECGKMVLSCLTITAH